MDPYFRALQSKFITLPAILIFCCTYLISQPEIIQLSQEDLQTQHHQYFIEEEGSKNLDEIRAIYEAGEFKNTLTDTIHNFNPEHSYWVHFQVENSGSVDGQWVFDFQGWSYVDFHYSKDSAEYQMKETGHLMDYPDRDYPAGNKSYILTTLKSQEQMSCFVKLDPVPNNSIVPASLGFTVMPRHSADHKQLIFRSIVIALIAIYIIFFIYNFFIYLSTRDSAYLYYLCLVIMGFFLTLNYSGYFFEFFSFLENTYQYQLTIENFIYNGFSIFLILFTFRLFQVKERYPKWYKGGWIMIGIMAINTIAVYFDYALGMSLSMPTFLIFTIAAVTFAIKNIRAGYPSAVFYLIGFGTVFIAGIINIMAVQVGSIPKTMFTVSLIIPFGQVIEMLFYSFALANKINVLKKENEIKNLKIIEVLEEKKQMQEEVNKQLEIKVKERTLEIQKQKEIIEEEKNKAEELLLNILPKQTAEELKQTGHATPKFYENVTIMFTDFEKFSAITKEMDSEELVSELDQCFKAFDEIVGKYGIEKIKTIGDSYMCASGMEGNFKEHALTMVNAAMDIHDYVDAWNKDKIAHGKKPWNIRIGIHSGSVAAGVVGKKKFAFDIWGPSVNLASRMESTCEPGQVNISSSTYQLVKDKYDCLPRGEVKVKNIGKVEMFFVDRHLN